MKQRLITSSISTILYLVIANIGNFFFASGKKLDWTSTIWEALFFFIFIFLLLGFKNNSKK